MTRHTVNTTIVLQTVECCDCHTVFAMTSELMQQRRNDHKTFYCPLGHGQVFTGLTEADKLRERLKATERDMNYYAERMRGEERRAEAAERKASARKGVITRMKNRAANGVCPHPDCHRHFANLEAHIKTVHNGEIPDSMGDEVTHDH